MGKAATCDTSFSWGEVRIVASPVPVQLPDKTLGKEAKDHPKTWAPCIHVGDPWPWTSSAPAAPATAAIWGSEQQMKSLSVYLVPPIPSPFPSSLSVCIFQRKKNFEQKNITETKLIYLVSKKAEIGRKK